MAKLYPSDAAASSPAEQKILDLIREQVSDEWIVLHSLRLSRHRNKLIGEADFVAFTKDCLLVLEVKGGRLSVSRGTWYQNDKKMAESPIDQAWGNFFSLQKYIEDCGMPSLPGGALCLFTDSQLSATRGDIKSPEWEPFQIRTARDIFMLGLSHCFEETRKEYLNKWRSQRSEPRNYTDQQLGALLEKLKPTIISHPRYSDYIKEDRFKLLELSDSQHEFLSLIDKPRILVNGPAGSGKTILGYKACKKFLSRNPNKNAAFICSSAYLARDVERWAAHDNLRNSLHVHCADTLLGHFVNRMIVRPSDFQVVQTLLNPGESNDDSYCFFGLGSPAGFSPQPHPSGVTEWFGGSRVIGEEDFKSYIEACYSQGLLEKIWIPKWNARGDAPDCSNLNLDLAYDFVVVDEGQDFSSAHVALSILNLWVKGGLKGGNVIWLQDLNQCLPNPDSFGVDKLGTPFFVPESLGYHQIDLDKINFRNPYTIGVITSKLLRSSQEVVSQRRESIPNTVHFLEAPLLGKDTYAQFFSRLLDLLWHLEDAGVEPQDVMLVTVAGTYDAGLLGLKLLQTETGSYDFIHVEYASSHEPHASSADKRIVWSRLFDAKGREFPVVILVDLPDLESEFGRSQAYVAATRATSLLYILGSKSQLDQWRPLFRT